MARFGEDTWPRSCADLSATLGQDQQPLLVEDDFRKSEIYDLDCSDTHMYTIRLQADHGERLVVRAKLLTYNCFHYQECGILVDSIGRNAEAGRGSDLHDLLSGRDGILQKGDDHDTKSTTLWRTRKV